jgi:hypothetical protein
MNVRLQGFKYRDIRYKPDRSAKIEFCPEMLVELAMRPCHSVYKTENVCCNGFFAILRTSLALMFICCRFNRTSDTRLSRFICLVFRQMFAMLKMFQICTCIFCPVCLQLSYDEP